MKHIEIEANGYTFDVAIDETTELGALALSVSLKDLTRMLTNTALDMKLSPANISELNSGGKAIVYSLA